MTRNDSTVLMLDWLCGVLTNDCLTPIVSGICICCTVLETWCWEEVKIADMVQLILLYPSSFAFNVPNLSIQNVDTPTILDKGRSLSLKKGMRNFKCLPRLSNCSIEVFPLCVSIM